MKTRMYSLRQQLSRILIAVILILTAIAVVVLGVLVQAYQRYEDERRKNTLSAYAEELDNSILQLNDVTGTLYSTNAAFDGLNAYKATGAQYNDVYSLLNTLEIQVRSNQNLEGLFVFYNSGENQIHSLRDSVSYRDQETLKETGRIAVEHMSSNTYRTDYEGAVIATDSAVYYNVFLKKTLATIMGTVRLDRKLAGELDETAAYGIFYQGKFYRIFGADIEPEVQSVESIKEEGNTLSDQVIYLKKLSSTGIYAAELLPKSIWIYIHWGHILLAALILVLTVMLLRFYQMITYQISRPLEDMTRALKEIQAGVWEVDFQAENHLTEIENVRDTVKLLLSEIEQYKIRSYEEKLETQKTKLQFLSLQLAPHFYTNCLKNAYYMLMLQEYDNVEKFLLCLSSHLRYLLNNDRERVSVQTEREFLENYIELQRLMSDKPLLCEIEIPEELGNVEIPVLALQTFVENSVKYTKGSGGQGLKIQVHVSLQETEEGSYLDIQVKDNGEGYPEEVLAMLNQKEPSASGKLGVGIVNLISRVKLQYGEKAKWYFENRNGASSELLLPLGEERHT